MFINPGAFSHIYVHNSRQDVSCKHSVWTIFFCFSKFRSRRHLSVSV